MTTIGRTTSCSANRKIAFGSARRTDVSRTCVRRPSGSGAESGMASTFVTTAGSLRRISAASAASRRSRGGAAGRCGARRRDEGGRPRGAGPVPPPGAGAPWAGLPWTAGLPSVTPDATRHVRHGRPDTHRVTQSSPAFTRRTRSAPEASLARSVRAHDPQEVDPPEVRPVRLPEVELGVRALPQQEAAEPLLARRPDHEVRVRLTLRVEVIGDVLDVELLDHVVEARAGLGVLAQHRADGVGDLAATAVPDGDVDVQTLDVARAVLGGEQGRRRRGRQQVERAHDLHAPTARGREVADGALDDGQQRLELLGRAREVVSREHPERDDLDADLLAPGEQLRDLVGTAAVTCCCRLPDVARPPPVAVEDHADVARYLRTWQ